MTAIFRKPVWSPYLVGAGIGVLSWITFGLMGKALGTSTTMVRVTGIVESAFSPAHVENNEYYAKYIIDKPAIDWQMLLVLGLVIGAFVSAKLSRSIEVEHVPALWKHRFGESRLGRYLAAFLGGVLVLFGARLAGGCTSGHGISGGLQFAIGSWVFFASFFAAGVVMAFAMFGKEGALMLTLDSPRNLFLGLLTGLVFGFLLQRGGVTRYRIILGQFLLVNHTVLRVMLTAVVVGSIGVYAMHQMFDVGLHVKSATILGNITGGLIFGVGMAILGYCPGTGIAAIGDGSRHAIPGAIGMLVGAGLYAELYPWFNEHVLSTWSFGKITLSEATGLSVWIYIAILVLLAAVIFALLPKSKPSLPSHAPAT